MATGTIYLRPCADISFTHNLRPSTLTSGYMAINEEVSDGQASYIYADRHLLNIDGEVNSATSKFSLGSTNDYKKINKVTGAVFHCLYNMDLDNGENAISCTLHTIESDFEVMNVEAGDTVGYIDYNQECTDIATKINEYLSSNGGQLPPMQLSIWSEAKRENAKDGSSYAEITQVYLELICEYVPIMVRKVESEWKPVRKFYRKGNGVWAKIAADEYKSLMQSNRVIDKCDWLGHTETAIADIAATCLETGMTGGKYCSFCGVTIKEHDTVIPALGHNEVAARGTATCLEDGMTGGTECLRCGITIKEHDTVQPALGHNFHKYTGECSRCDVCHDDSFAFTIQRNTQTSASTYHSMPNVTWREWVNEQLSFLGGFQITSDNRVRYYTSFLGTTLDYTVDDVTADDLIVAGQAYTATDATQ